MFKSSLAISLLILLVSGFSELDLSGQVPPATGGKPLVTSWRVERAKLDADYEIKLRELEQWCAENAVSITPIQHYKRTLQRDLNRQTIFVPAENCPAAAGQPELDRKLIELNAWQAARVLDLAKQAAESDAGGAAIQLLNEVLYFDCNHAEVRKMLGHKKTAEGWALYPDRIAIRKATRDHEICRWPAKSYWVANTPNFQIESNASEEQIQVLAESLERWHYVWRQVYFDYWSNPSRVRRWIAGDGSFAFGRRKKYRVVFFQNQADYLSVLMPLVPGVEVSSGFYSNPKSMSFFYAAQDSSGDAEATWKHELTHQLFRESIGSGKDLKLFENEWIWLDEGAATYAESLTDFGDYVTLGGFDSERMQFARIRLLLEGYQIPLAELSQLGRNGLQRRPDIVRLYNQIAGQYDMLINDHQGAHELQLVLVLQSLYRGKAIKADKFESQLGVRFEELDQRYREYLIVDADSIVKHLSAPLTRTKLSFAKSKLNDDCYSVVGQCHNLIWLDLSTNRIGASEIGSLKSCQALQQLILTQCPLEPGALRALADLPQLIELDLSGSSVTDQQLLELQGQTNLKRLLLKSTHVTDSGAAKLKQLLPEIEIVR